MSSLDIKEEIKKCAEDPVYFMCKYINVIHPIKGVVPFHLFEFQKRIVSEVGENRFNIIRKFRQAGVTTICAAYSLWSIIFKKHHYVMVVSIGDRESTAFLGRVMDMYYDLPRWLQPEIREKNKHTLLLSSGSKIKSQPAGAGRGESVSHLIVDEAAFVEKMRAFWAAIYPTISTGGKATLLSTVNGMSNLYYELYRDAQLAKNNFNIVDITWPEHPDYTEKWSEETKGNMPHRLWLQEYECEFLGTGDTFIDYQTLRKVVENVSDEYYSMYAGALRVFEDPIPYHEYVIGADASYGREFDYSAFHVINLYDGKQVAEFHSNTMGLKDFAKTLADVGRKYNSAYVAPERNGLGIALVESLFEDLEYENMWMDDKGEFGVKVDTKSREIILGDLEDALRTNKLDIRSRRLADELTTFIITENGKVEADEGYNDDLVMSLAHAAHVAKDVTKRSPGMPTKATPQDGDVNRQEVAKQSTWIPTTNSKYNDPEIDEYLSWLNN
jgi:hypothetical protein